MRTAGLLIGLLFAMTLPVLAQEASDSATKSKIAALEGAWNRPTSQEMPRRWTRLLDNAIVLVNDDGSVQTKKEFLATVKPSGSQGAQEQQVAPGRCRCMCLGIPRFATAYFRAKGVEARNLNVRGTLSIHGSSRTALGLRCH